MEEIIVLFDNELYITYTIGGQRNVWFELFGEVEASPEIQDLLNRIMEVGCE